LRRVTGKLVGDPLEMVADLDAAGLAPLQEVQVVQDQQAHLAGQHTVQGLQTELGGGGVLTTRVAEELQHLPVEVLHAGVAGQPHPAHRPPLMPLHGEAAVLGDLPAVECAGEGEHRRGLAQSRERVDGHRPLGLVAILEVAVHDVPQVLVQRGELRSADRTQIGVPHPAGTVVGAPRPGVQGLKLAAAQRPGLDAARRVGERLEVLLPRQRQIPRIRPARRGGHTSSRASA
jgi:hypothetical protein